MLLVIQWESFNQPALQNIRWVISRFTIIELYSIE
jgi:hypothetical protein